MGILVISDIHANLSALEEVIADAGEIDAAWCLGDLVGYGPHPNECIALIQGLPGLKCLLGNHDAAVLERIDPLAFNHEARQAILWTQEVLTPDSLAFLVELPEKIVAGEVTLVHGSPRQPVWEYLLDVYAATRNFAHFDTPYCFIGHTHLPIIFQLGNGRAVASLNIPDYDQALSLVPRMMINPGSVGQPRDRNPQAAYALFDPESSRLEFRRVAYDIASVQQSMQAAGLPERHIQRLTMGY